MNPATDRERARATALYVDAGAVAVGVLGEFMNAHPELTEHLLFTGAALATQAINHRLEEQAVSRYSSVRAIRWVRARLRRLAAWADPTPGL